MNGTDFMPDPVIERKTPHIPGRCLPWTILKFTTLDSFFYSYIVLTVVATGFLMNAIYLAILRTSSVPIGRLYNRFLVFISVMELFYLATRLQEAIWTLMTQFKLVGMATENTTGLFVILMLMHCIRALSLYSIICTVCWLYINCKHDIQFFYNGNTSSLLDKLNDCRGYKSLTLILLSSLCIAAITEIPVIEIKGPYCLTFTDGDEITFKNIFVHDRRKGLLSTILRIAKGVIPVCFIMFILFQLVTMVTKLKQTIKLKEEAHVHHRRNHAGNGPSPGNKDQLLPCRSGTTLNDSCNQGATQPKDETNDIQLTFFYLIIPMTAQYLLLWGPYHLVNSFNALHPLTTKTISNSYIIWIFYSMTLLTSTLNPIFFILANGKYYMNLILEPDRSRRITQETNV